MDEPDMILITYQGQHEADVFCATGDDKDSVKHALDGIDECDVEGVYRISPADRTSSNVTSVAAELWFYRFGKWADRMACDEDIPPAYVRHIDLDELNDYICAHSGNAAAESKFERAEAKGDYQAACAREGD